MVRFDLPYETEATGWSQEAGQVGQFSVGSADLLTGYYDAVHERSLAFVATLSDSDLDKVVDVLLILVLKFGRATSALLAIGILLVVCLVTLIIAAVKVLEVSSQLAEIQQHQDEFSISQKHIEESSDLTVAQPGVALALTSDLDLSRNLHARRYANTGFADQRRIVEVIQIHPRHLQMDVESFEHRTRNTAHVLRDLAWRAIAVAERVTEASARTGVHGRNELELRRVLHVRRCSRYGYNTRL